MQKKNIVRFASLAALALVVAGCGPKEPSEKPIDDRYVDTYSATFIGDASTFDYLADYHQPTFQTTEQLIDGLLEFDPYGMLQGAMAESWSRNDDATVWTFKLKKGQQWYANDGSKYGEVTADDWVAGLQHCLDAKGGAEYVAAPIVNANEYMAGGCSFDKVGVKAIDKHTIEYTLVEPTPFFDTMLEYGPFWPLNREFFESKGCGFGDKWDANVCKFGQLGDPTSILYNGAYLLTEYTTGSKVTMKANKNYWGYDDITTRNIVLVHDDGSNPDAALTAFANGNYSAAGISRTLLDRAHREFKDNMYLVETESTTFYGAFNFNRKCYENGSVKSPKTEKEKEDTKKAILNANFRKAFVGAWDIPSMQAQTSGDELKNAAIRNTLCAPGFASLPADYDGMKAGTDYTKVVEHYLNQMEDTVFDGDIDDGHAAFHNPDKAKVFAAKARTELAAEGVEFPIAVDILVLGTSVNQKNQGDSFKQAIEETLGTDFIKINLVAAPTVDEYYAASFYATSADQVFYDFYYGSGWGPDYADPQTYVNIYGYGNDMMNHVAIDTDPTSPYYEADKAAYEAILGDYTDKLDAAKAETRDIAKRYALFAQAEASLLASAGVTPYSTRGGNYAVTRIIPHTVPYCKSGTDMDRYKWFRIQKDILTTEEVAKYRADWEKERERRYAAKK